MHHLLAFLLRNRFSYALDMKSNGKVFEMYSFYLFYHTVISVNCEDACTVDCYDYNYLEGASLCVYAFRVRSVY